MLNNLTVIFEGINGCGKTTQVNLLHKHFNSREGVKVEIRKQADQTKDTQLSRSIAWALNTNGVPNEVTQMLISYERTHSRMEEAKLTDRLIIKDRGQPSGVVYSCVGSPVEDHPALIAGTQYLEYVDMRERKEFTVYLGSDVRQSLQRAKCNKPDRYEKEEILHELERMFREYCYDPESSDNIWVKPTSICETHQLIVDAIEQYILKHNSNQINISRQS